MEVARIMLFPGVPRNNPSCLPACTGSGEVGFQTATHLSRQSLLVTGPMHMPSCASRVVSCRVATQYRSMTSLHKTTSQKLAAMYNLYSYKNAEIRQVHHGGGVPGFMA